MEQEKDKLSDQNKAKMVLSILAAKAIARMSPEEVKELNEEMKAKQKEVKPDWITEEQWEAIPYSDHWLNQKKGAEYIKQSKPATPEESKAQFERLRNEKNWKQKETKYLTEAHQKSSEAAMQYIAESKKSPMPLKEALKQQSRNSKDH